MSSEPYSGALAGYVPECRKAELCFTVSTVLANSVRGRNLQLVRPPTRVVAAGTVVEMVCTAEHASPGQCVQDVAYLCFAEAVKSGVLVVGDRLRAGEFQGVVIGFNEAHAPNHINVVIGTGQAASGRSLGFEPGDPIVVVARDYDGYAREDSVREGGALLPRIRVEWLQGRSEAQRQALVDGITKLFVDVVKVRPDQVNVVFDEIPPDLLYKGGVSWADKSKAGDQAK